MLHFVDTSSDVVDALRRTFRSHRDEVTVAQGDITQVAVGVAVSPANSHGFMDGGVDRSYAELFGPMLVQAVRDACLAQPEGHLPVGAAVVVPTHHDRIHHLVVAPTMFMPEHVPAQNAYRALRAVLRLMSASPELGQDVYCPGLTTLVGGVPPDLAASEMLAAYEDWRRSELSQILSIAAPPGWVRADAHGLFAFAPAAELAAAGGYVGDAAVSIGVGFRAVPAGLTATEVIERLMVRRVTPRAKPDRFSVKVSGVESSCIDWTDGVADILSFFVVTKGVVVEFEASRLMIGAPPFPEPSEVAATLFAGVVWR